VRVHRQARDEHALDQLVRVVLHQQPILASSGLAFVSVHHDVFRLGRIARHKAPLHAGGKTRASAPPEIRGFHFLDYLLGLHPERFFEGHVSVGREIRVN